MTIINDLDLGLHPTWLAPFQTQKGQIARLKTQAVQNRGGKEFYYMEGAEFPDRTETIWVTAISPAATLILVNQLLELVGNPDLNKPCFIQWASGGGIVTSDPQDGWYFILEAEPDTEFSWTTYLPVKLSVRKMSSASARFTAMRSVGGLLNTSFNATGSYNLLMFPVNTIPISGGVTRTGAEGALNGTIDQTNSLCPIVLSSVVADWFHGGCHVYDTVAPYTTNTVGGGNFLVNPSFETADPNDGTTALGWYRMLTGTGNVTLETANPHTGSRDFALTNPSALNYGGIGSKSGSPVAGIAQITVSGWVKSSIAGGNLLCRVIFAPFSSSNIQVSGQPGTVYTDFNYTPTAAYSQFAFNVTAPAGALYAYVELYNYNSGLGYTQYLDDIVITDSLANPDWVEVYGTDHRFAGDMVITNGLLLCVAAAQQLLGGMPCYLWNTALATPAWQQVGTPEYLDNIGSEGYVQHVNLLRLGSEECVFQTTSSTNGGQIGQFTCRLQRGHYFLRIDFRPLTQNTSYSFSVFNRFPSNLKVAFNSQRIADQVFDTAPTSATDYGYGAAFINSVAYPYIAGFLYQNPPTNQPASANATTTYIGAGDTTGPALNTTRSYGYFATPFGSVSSGTTVNKLQAEAESGTLSGGAVLAVDSTASPGSGNSVVKFPTATGIGLLDTAIGPAWAPPAGTYVPWFRLKTGSLGAGSTNEIQLQVWNVTDGNAPSFLNLKPNQLNTVHQWYALPTFTPVAGKTYFFRFGNLITTTVDWYFDQCVLAPLSLASGFGPAEVWQQFIYDRSTEIIQD